MKGYFEAVRALCEDEGYIEAIRGISRLQRVFGEGEGVF